MPSRDGSGSAVWRGAVAGAVGGVLGSTAMVGFNHLVGGSGLAQDDQGHHHREHRVDAKPNDTDGTIADEPASRKAASNVVEAITGERLKGRPRQIGGAIAHHAFGAIAGAMYGAMAARVPAVTAGGGAPYGAFVWLTAVEAGMPLVGLSRRPVDYPPKRHAASLATHLIFGATVEAVRRLLTRETRDSRQRARLDFGDDADLIPVR